jgi:hypothetical protein
LCFIVALCFSQSGNQRKPLFEGGFELQFTAHGALGNSRDLRLDAEHIGHLVDAFLLDDGAVHVCDQQFLAPPRTGHHVDVDGPAGEQIGGDAVGDEQREIVEREIRATGKAKFPRFVMGEPPRLATHRRRDQVRNLGSRGGIEGAAAGARDQGEDAVGHGAR